jgi:hypothetical protein
MGEDHQAQWARQEQQVRHSLHFRDARRNGDNCMADDDSATRPDNQLYRRYIEYDRSAGRPDGIRDQRTQRVRGGISFVRSGRLTHLM